MGLEHSVHIVEKTDESVEVCAVVANNCTAAFTFPIRFVTHNTSAGKQQIICIIRESVDSLCRDGMDMCISL